MAKIPVESVVYGFLKAHYGARNDHNPKLALKFFKNDSILAFTFPDGSVKSVTTLKNIETEVMEGDISIKHWLPKLDTVHINELETGAIMVDVQGTIISRIYAKKEYTEMFWLMPIGLNSYYIERDFIQLMEVNISETSPTVVADDKGIETDMKNLRRLYSEIPKPTEVAGPMASNFQSKIDLLKIKTLVSSLQDVNQYLKNNKLDEQSENLLQTLSIQTKSEPGSDVEWEFSVMGLSEESALIVVRVFLLFGTSLRTILRFRVSFGNNGGLAKEVKKQLKMKNKVFASYSEESKYHGEVALRIILTESNLCQHFNNIC